jgi:hypothetical protein
LLTRPFTREKVIQIVTKQFLMDQPVGCAPAIEAVGAPANTWFLKCTLGNINIEGTRLQKAFTATTIVTFIPLSPDVTLPT